MEIDHLKEMWRKENIGETPEISIEMQKEIHLPLEKIRQNMKMEFWSLLTAMILLIPLSKYFTDNSFIRWTLYSVLFFITFYYNFKFYVFYKKLSFTDLSTYQSLLELRYNLKLNLELYKSYYISSVPLFLALFLLFLQKHDFFNYKEPIMNYAPFILFFAVVAIVLGFGKWWWDFFYKKYLIQLEKILNQLK